MLNLFGSVYRLKSSLRIESWKIGFGSSQKIPGSATLVFKSQFWNLAEWALIHMLWQQLHKTLYELFDIGCDSCICCDSGYCFDTVLVCIVSYIIYTYKYIHFLYCDACSSKRLGWLFCCRYYGKFILLNFHIKKLFKL